MVNGNDWATEETDKIIDQAWGNGELNFDVEPALLKDLIAKSLRKAKRDAIKEAKSNRTKTSA